MPLRYEDETRLTPIASAHAGQIVQVEGEVVRSEVIARGRRNLLVELRDKTGTIGLRFFNFYPSQLKQLATGRRVRAIGEARGGLFGLELAHPRYSVVSRDTPLPTALTPVYPAAAGLGQGVIRQAVLGAVRRMTLPETVPAAIIESLALPALVDALRTLHQPGADIAPSALAERSHPAWRRVIFDELLAQQLSLRLARAARATQSASALLAGDRVKKLLAQLPFKLTGAQQRAWREVSDDLRKTQPMNRLLQGDVGSGKTVVAALAAAQSVGSGFQVALMAPTEILAEQHLHKLSPWMNAIGVRMAWLSGSLKASQKKTVRNAVAAGEVDLLVGTHALIEDSVGFERLGLAIVDEQHRFGVAQRLALRGKHGGAAGSSDAVGAAGANGTKGSGDYGHVPHQLMMSATPIPRTLAMTYYADLDVSVIDELPPGRKPVTTKLLSAARRADVIARVRAAVAEGRQAYWVCPLIEESEVLDLQTAIDTHASLAEELAPLQVGLMHGRMPAADKQAVMNGFIRSEVQVLVATTVIEVGVDVANASLMVIEHAERFGLAQLHQLRGRVGRGADESVCVLLFANPLSPTARERLKVMYETTDGFEIARRDLTLRGPGEFLGARQSGVPLLRFADLQRDADLVEAARDAAVILQRDHPQQADEHLVRWLGGREEFLRA